jgi:hypothetical protein
VTTFTPSARKLLLTTHVAASVGWLGAVAAFLALGLVGLTSENDETVRGVYLVMEPAAWLVLVPLAVASLVTGLIQSVATPWGLFRHYWVVFKLLINIISTAILLMYMSTFDVMAARAADRSVDLDSVRTPSPVLHSGLALALLLVATTLAVYKPRGMTPYGQRKQRTRWRHRESAAGSR